MRIIYYLIIYFHPRAFRIRFGGEMMSIFDEQQHDASETGLMVDGLRSLMRQWLRSSVFWTFTGAALIAGLQAWWIIRVLQKASSTEQSAAGADKHGAITLPVVIVFGFLATATTVGVWNFCFMRRRAVRSCPLRTSQNSTGVQQR
jgi:hypothetical protein